MFLDFDIFWFVLLLCMLEITFMQLLFWKQKGAVASLLSQLEANPGTPR